MWFRIDESKNDKDFYLEQINEAMADLRDSMIDDGLYTEGENKIITWMRNQVTKLCPSPDKLKDFFAKYGKKIDNKMANAKNDTLKQAWEGIKSLVSAQKGAEAIVNAPEENNSEGQGEEQQGGNNEEQQGNAEQGNANNQEQGGDNQNGGENGEGENQQQQAAESVFGEKFYSIYDEDDDIYEEGFFDAVKSGWNKITGKEQQKPAKKGTKKAPAKKGTAKKAPAKKGAAKKPAAKGKGKGKRPSKKEAQTTAQKILQFCKQHWKGIAMVIGIGLALAFFGWPAIMWLLKGKAVMSTVSTLAKATNVIKPSVTMYANGSVTASGDYIDTDDLDF